MKVRKAAYSFEIKPDTALLAQPHAVNINATFLITVHSPVLSSLPLYENLPVYSYRSTGLFLPLYRFISTTSFGK